jgi:hypothetical protein
MSGCLFADASQHISSHALRCALIVALCTALALLNGCSALRLGYNQADRLAYLWLDRYVDFDNAQAPRVREAIGNWFSWNRRTQLADYTELLVNVDAEIMADTTPERACGWWSTIRVRFDRGIAQAVPAIAEIAVTLKPAQLDAIENRNAKTNKEYRDDFMQPDPAVRQIESARRAASRYEWLYGDLETFQKERLERWATESPWDPKLGYDERLRRQKDALQVLRRLSTEPVDTATAQAQIRAWLARIDPPPGDPYRLQNDKVIKHNCRVFADLHNSTSPAQREAASKRLRGWAADLRALAAERTE